VATRLAGETAYADGYRSAVRTTQVERALDLRSQRNKGGSVKQLARSARFPREIPGRNEILAIMRSHTNWPYLPCTTVRKYTRTRTHGGRIGFHRESENAVNSISLSTRRKHRRLGNTCPGLNRPLWSSFFEVFLRFERCTPRVFFVGDFHALREGNQGHRIRCRTV